MSSTQEAGEIFGEGRGPAQAMLRSPTVLIVSIGLWGMNLFFFRLFQIDYNYVLNYDLMVEKETIKENNATIKNLSGGSGSGACLDDTDDLSSHNDEEKDSMLEMANMDNVSNGSVSNMNNSNINNNSNGITMGKSIVLMRHNSDGLSSVHGTSALTSTNVEVDSLRSTGVTTTGNAVTWGKLVMFSVSLLLLLQVTYYIWIDKFGRGSIGAVFTFYSIVLVYIMIPLPSTRWLRKSVFIVLQRSLELIKPRFSCCWWTYVLHHQSHSTSTSNKKSESPLATPSTSSSPSSSIIPVLGPRPIPFIDVFFADAMCSLSKVFFDWGMLLHMASHYPEPVPAAMHNILFPSACAAVPYLIRARQCLIMHTVGRLKNDPKRYQHIANAIKYSTSIFPLCLSAYQQTIDKDHAKQLDNVLLFLLTVNALYALYWDIVMDWGMMQNPSMAVQVACIGGGTAIVPFDDRSTGSSSSVPHGAGPSSNCHHGLLRPRLRFGLVLSTMILITDAVLRFSWLLRFAKGWFPNPDSFVLCTQFLEVFRRAIWNLLRVEWEQIKQKAKLQKARDSFSDDEKEDDLVPFVVGQNASIVAKVAIA